MESRQIVYEGMRSPWGKVDYCELLTPFLGSVGTPGHGGLKVSAEYNRKIPAIFRKEGGWYEEDCAWAIPMYFLQEEIQGNALEGQLDYINKTVREGVALQTLKQWYWKEYEQHFDVILSEKESNLKAKYVWASQNADKWQVICANCLDNNDVKLILTIGGKRSDNVEEREIIVDRDVYNKIKSKTGFSSRIALDSFELIILDKNNDAILAN